MKPAHLAYHVGFDLLGVCLTAGKLTRENLNNKGQGEASAFTETEGQRVRRV